MFLPVHWRFLFWTLRVAKVLGNEDRVDISGTWRRPALSSIRKDIWDNWWSIGPWSSRAAPRSSGNLGWPDTERIPARSETWFALSLRSRCTSYRRLTIAETSSAAAETGSGSFQLEKVSAGKIRARMEDRDSNWRRPVRATTSSATGPREKGWSRGKVAAECLSSVPSRTSHPTEEFRTWKGFVRRK